MATRIERMDTTIQDETITLTTEHGETFTAKVVASDGGYTIANYDDGQRWHAIEIADFGDGDAEFYDHAEGDIFDAEFLRTHVVERADNAGSLLWVDTEAR